MSSDRLKGLSDIIRHAWTEPKHKALMDWVRDYGLGSQLARQVPRAEIDDYVDGKGWRTPDRLVTVELHVMPDFDWWEPRHDQPWRRLAARDRAFEEARWDQ